MNDLTLVLPGIFLGLTLTGYFLDVIFKQIKRWWNKDSKAKAGIILLILFINIGLIFILGPPAPFTIFLLLFIWGIFWRKPSSIYKNSKTNRRAVIKVFLYCIIPFYFLYAAIDIYFDYKYYELDFKHNRITKYIEDGLNQCHNIAPQLNHAFKLSFDCSALNEVSSYQKVTYDLKDAGYKNVHYSYSEPALGMTSIFYKDSKVYIRTKVEDIDNLIFRDEKILERVIDINL